MSDGAVPMNSPVPMTPPILEKGGLVGRGRTVNTKGRSPDHGDMTILQLALKRSVDLGHWCLVFDFEPGDAVVKAFPP